MHTSQSSPNCMEAAESEAGDRLMDITTSLASPSSSSFQKQPISMALNTTTNNYNYRPIYLPYKPHTRQRRFVEQTAGNLSTSLHTLSSMTHRPNCSSSSSSRICGQSGPLERRHNKSCDWSQPANPLSSSAIDGAGGSGSARGFPILRSFNNPIAQVSTDILRGFLGNNPTKNFLMPTNMA
uniref:Uncharacterized protein n=1 Tax=Ditylenchus dipsaci TaxID=166011 RepID=A0A915ESJ1_9BILA